MFGGSRDVHISRPVIVGLVGALALAAAGCGVKNASESVSDDSGSGEPITVTGAAGPVELDGTAEHVAVLQWQFAEDLLELGVEPTMIADEQYKGGVNPIPVQLEDQLAAFDYISLGSRTAPNLEQLASEEVDVIVADETEHAQNVDQLSTFAPTLLLDTNDWANFFPNLEALGTAVGKEDEAEALAQDVKDSFAAAAEQVADAGFDGSVLLVIPTADQLYAFTGTSMQAGVLEQLELEYAYEDKPGILAEPIPLETLNQLDPDALFVTYDPGTPIVTDTWEGNPLWESIPAVENGLVIDADRSVWSVGRGTISAKLMAEQAADALSER